MDKVIRRSMVVTVALVGILAAVLSFRHQADLALPHGETPWSSALWPFTVDGLLVAGTIAMLDAARRSYSRGWARTAVLAGVGMTLWANCVHGVPYGPAGVAVAAWPPVAMIISIEVLVAVLRKRTALERISEPPAGGLDPYSNALATLNGSDPDVSAVLRAGFDGDTPSIRRIREVLGCGQPRAQQVQGRIRALAA
jgi:hypothetical protein